MPLVGTEPDPLGKHRGNDAHNIRHRAGMAREGTRRALMCGFVVITGEEACAPGRIESAVAALAHPGPDGQGTWRATDGRIAMGHTRLAISAWSKSPAQ